MIIDCIADLHGYYPKLEGGDLLIVAGDLTARDEVMQYAEFDYWLSKQDYKKKIIVGGNHDNWLQNEPFQMDRFHENSAYLCDSGTEFEGLKIWGSPWTKTFEGMNPRCKAFTVDTEDQLSDKWALIPDRIDILITHSPPFGVLDQVIRGDRFIEGHQCDKFENAGSKSLYGWLKYVERPKLHVFGHIHEGHGYTEHFFGYNETMVKSVNASYVNEKYQPVNKPIRVIL